MDRSEKSPDLATTNPDPASHRKHTKEIYGNHETSQFQSEGGHYTTKEYLGTCSMMKFFEIKTLNIRTRYSC